MLKDQERFLVEQSTAMLDALFESAPVGLAIFDRDLRYVRINDALAELNGVPPEDHVGRTLADVVPDVAEIAEPEFRRVLETGEPLLEWDLAAETAAVPGRVRHFTENIYPLTNEAGEVTGLGAIVVEVTDRRRADEAHRAAEVRRSVIAHLVEAQELERKRIAADVHDDVLQAVTAVGARLDNLQREHPAAGEEIAEVRQAMRLAVRRLRDLVFTLRPPALDLGGLVDAIRLYLDEQRSEWGLEYTLESDLADDPPEAARVLLYRIAQEAITNVRRHASADVVEVSVSEMDGGVCLAITDNGKGVSFDALEDVNSRHFGLAMMRERADQAGGWWRMESAPAGGTIVRCWVPAAEV